MQGQGKGRWRIKCGILGYTVLHLTWAYLEKQESFKWKIFVLEEAGTSLLCGWMTECIPQRLHLLILYVAVKCVIKNTSAGERNDRMCLDFVT